MVQFLALASNNESEPWGHCLTQRCEMQMNSNIDNSRPSRKQRTWKLPGKVLYEHTSFFFFFCGPETYSFMWRSWMGDFTDHWSPWKCSSRKKTLRWYRSHLTVKVTRSSEKLAQHKSCAVWNRTDEFTFLKHSHRTFQDIFHLEDLFLKVWIAKVNLPIFLYCSVLNSLRKPE